MDLKKLLELKLEEHMQHITVSQQKIEDIIPIFKETYNRLLKNLEELIENSLLSSQDIFETLKTYIPQVEDYQKKYEEIAKLRERNKKEFETFKSFLENPRDPETYTQQLFSRFPNFYEIIAEAMKYLQEAKQEIEKIRAIAEIYKTAKEG